MSSKSLYNKYRPKTFKEVVGQDATCSIIKNEIDTDSLHHSIIFYGPRGTGKTTLGRIIANSITLPSDIIEKDAANVGKVADVRAIQNELIYSPWEGKYKVYIFDEAHRITTAAFDSLLKTTEEAPDHVKFIFVTTNFGGIPATIKSRSKCFYFNLLSRSDIEKVLNRVLKLEKIELNEELLQTIITSSLGSARDAIVLLDTTIKEIKAGTKVEEILSKLGVVKNKDISDFISFHLFGDFRGLYKSIDIFLKNSSDLDKSFNILLQFVVDLRLGYACRDLIPSLKSNISNLIEDIDTQRAKYDTVQKANNSVPYNVYIGRRLDSIKDITIKLLKDLPYIYNKNALLNSYLIDLIKGWK